MRRQMSSRVKLRWFICIPYNAVIAPYVSRGFGNSRDARRLFVLRSTESHSLIGYFASVTQKYYVLSQSLMTLISSPLTKRFSLNEKVRPAFSVIIVDLWTLERKFLSLSLSYILPASVHSIGAKTLCTFFVRPSGLFPECCHFDFGHSLYFKANGIKKDPLTEAYLWIRWLLILFRNPDFASGAIGLELRTRRSITVRISRWLPVPFATLNQSYYMMLKIR